MQSEDVTVKVADFGCSPTESDDLVASSWDDSWEDWGQRGAPCGALHYAAPETLTGVGSMLCFPTLPPFPMHCSTRVPPQDIAPAADVYGVGVLLLELLTPPGAVESGLPQADTQAALTLVRDCSPALQSLLAGMLDPLPSQRITSSAALDHPWFADVLGACDVEQ